MTPSETGAPPCASLAPDQSESSAGGVKWLEPIGWSESMSQSRDAPVATPVVIIVDDDEAVCESLKCALELEGLAVRTYSKGAELFDDLELRNCACFIVDQRLPGMTGMELVAALRERHITAPMILITSNPTVILREQAAKAAIP